MNGKNEPTESQFQNGTPDGQRQPQPESAGSGSSVIAPAVAIAIVVALIAAGGYYIWSAKLSDTMIGDEAAESAPAGDETLERLETQSASDELGAIESDLDATELEAIDEELNELEAELNNS